MKALDGNLRPHTRLDRGAGGIRFSCTLLLAVIAFQSPAACAVAPEGYQVAQSISVHDGCDCIIELLEDIRITEAIRKDIAERGNVFSNPTLYAVFDRIPIRNAAVQIVDRRGHVTDRREFDMPLATINEKPIRIGLPAPVAYELTVDRSRGELLSSGPNSYFFSVSKRKFAWIEFFDDATHRREELVGTMNVRNEFSTVDRTDRRGKDFLLIHCEFHPVGSNGEFTTTYTRVHFIAGEWRAKRRTKFGDFCKFDQ